VTAGLYTCFVLMGGYMYVQHTVKEFGGTMMLPSSCYEMFEKLLVKSPFLF
jgi:hypothetical protein